MAMRQALLLVMQVVLGRILAPQAFGLAAMVLVLTNFASVLVEGGFGAALVQRRTLEPRHIASVSALTRLMGLVIAAAVVVAGPLIADFYSEPALRHLSPIVALAFAISGFGIVPQALMLRALRFRRLAVIDLTALICSGFAGVGLALSGAGPASLAWQAVVFQVWKVSLLWRSARPPSRPVEAQALRDLRRFGLGLLGFNFLNYWVRNADNVIVGRIFGSVSLGIYSRAYALMLLPVEQIGGALTRVMFPSFSRMGEDIGRVRSAYLRAVGVTALVTAPLAAGVGLCAQELVLTLLGPQWLPMVPLVRIFGALGVVQGIVTTVGWLYTSQGRTDLQFRWGVGAGLALLASFAVGAWLGSVVRMAAAYAFVSGVLLTYPAIAIPGRLVGISFGDVLRAVRAALVAITGMAAGIVALRSALPAEWPVEARLAILVASGAVIYMLMLVVLRPPALVQLGEVVPPLGRILSRIGVSGASS